ncbi:MAG: TIGR01777 family oxidoreductase [Tenacibaculum sp.]
MTKVLITGGTGLVGKQLQKCLTAKGYAVAVLTRTPKKSNEFYWNIKKQFIDKKAFSNTTHIIHLAGAGIADKRWTQKRKKEIIYSRVESANLLFSCVKKYKVRLKGFISASGIGYYGAVSTNTIFEETDKPFGDFISKVCINWERASNQFIELNIPVTIFRIGIVLSKNGGVLKKLNTPLFLITLGKATQYMPWIHVQDLCLLYLKAVEDTKISGTYNAIAPEHHSNKTFTKELSKHVKKPFLAKGIPAFILKIILGKLSIILLNGSRVSSKKTQKIHRFQFPKLNLALKDIFKMDKI